MIHAGDLINNAETDAEWGEWFGAGIAKTHDSKRPGSGNHEMAKVNKESRLSPIIGGRSLPCRQWP